MSDRNLRIQLILSAIDKAAAPFRSVTKASTATGKALRDTQIKLKELDRAQKDLTGFRKLEGDLVTTSLELKKAKDQAAQLGRQFVAAENPSKRLTSQFNRARDAVARLEERQRREVRELGQLKTKLDAAGVASEGFAGYQARIERETEAANRQLDRQKSKLRELGDRQARMDRAKGVMGKFNGAAGRAAAVGAAGIGAAAALALPMKSELEESNAFESRMTDIAQKADLSRSAATKLGVTLRQTALRVNQMPEDLQNAADILAGFGLDVPIAVQLANPIGKTATAFKADMADLSAASFAAIDNLKVPADQVQLALDAMALSGNRGAFELKDMAGSFASLTAAYQGLGQKGVSAVADLASALQITRKGAADGSEAANNLANLLQKIAAPTTIKAFAKMGINLQREMKKAAAAGKTPIEAISDVTNKALKGDLSRLGYLFEDAQVQKALRPLIQNMAEYRSIRAEANNAGGTVDKAFAERMRDGAEQATALKVAVTDLKLELAAGLGPVINPLIAKIAENIRLFSQWAKEHPKLAQGLGKVAIIAAAVAGAVGLIALVVGPILVFIGLLGAAAVALGTTIGPLLAGIAAAIALVVVGVLAVVGAIKGWIRYGPAVKQFLAEVGRVLIEFGGKFIQAHVQFFNLGKMLMIGLANGIANGLGAVKSAVINAGASAVAWFKEKLGIHSPSRVFAGLGGFMMQGLGQGLQDGAGAPLRRIQAIAGGLTAAMAVAAAPAAMAGAGGVGLRQAGALAAAGAAPAGPTIINIKIVAAPGQDPQAIAKAVATELDRRERARGAAKRSSYSDGGD